MMSDLLKLRYPFYSCELLCCNNAKMIQAFFPNSTTNNEGLFGYFMKFAFSPDNEFNDVLSGYCAKVLSNLFSK